jgi:hypothetical protein
VGTVMKQNNNRGSLRLKPEKYIKAAEMLASWPTEKVHLTALRERKGPIKGKSFVKIDIKGMASWMAEQQSSPDRLNVYFHVNDLKEDLGPGKPKASKKDVAYMVALHVDADCPKQLKPGPEMEAAKTELIAKARALPLPPNVLINSGGGVPLYWTLEERVAVTPENLNDLEGRNKKLADDFGADDCWNIDRIMRAPWTINYPDKTKRERGRVMVSTSLIEDTSATTKFTIDQFASVPLKSKNKKADTTDSGETDAENDSDTAYVNIGSPAVPTQVVLSELNGKLRRLIKNGLKDGESFGDGSRSGFVYYVACELRRSGWEDGEIICVLTNPDFPVSEHILEQTQRDPIEQAARVIKDMNEKGVERKDAPPPKTATPDDFYAFLPQHEYMFVPTRSLWPAATVNSILNIPSKVSASVFLDRTKPLHQMTWWPGKPMVIEDNLVFEDKWIPSEGKNCFNRYLPPPEIDGDPKKAGPWRDHLHKLFPDDPDNTADRIEAWFAYKVQRPEAKINHCLVMGSRAHGVGKDTLIAPLRCAVGEWNFKDISAEQALDEKFNPFLEAVVMRINEARDLGDKDRFKFYDHTKTWMASPPETLSVADKNVKAHPVLNCVGIIISTNHKTDGLHLIAEDRRHFVSWTDITPDDFEADYWPRMYNWYQSENGYGHVAAHLATVDLKGFDPKEPPPKTPAFWEIVNANRAPEDNQLADVLDNLSILGDRTTWPDAITIEDLAQGAAKNDFDFSHWLRDPKNRRHLAHRLEQCGYSPLRNPEDKHDGQWRVSGKRVTVYTLAALNIDKRFEAVARLKWMAETTLEEQRAKRATRAAAAN